MRVQSHDVFGRAGWFEPETGRFDEKAGDKAVELAQHPLSGHYSRLGDQLAVFYRRGDGLRLRVGDLDISLDEGTKVVWSSESGISTFKVLTAGAVVICVSYPAASYVEGDLTPFVELEDFDFGLFVANVVASEERFNSIYRNS